MAQDNGRLADKVAIITGASTGTGPVMARLFVEQGAKVLMAARREELVASHAADIGLGAIAMRCDVTNEDDVTAMVDRALEEFGQVDILLNNAAAPGQDKYIWEQTLENWNATIAIDLTAAMLCSREVVRRSMLERKFRFDHQLLVHCRLARRYAQVALCVRQGCAEGLHQERSQRCRPAWHPLQLPGSREHRYRVVAELRQAPGRGRRNSGRGMARASV